MGPSIARQYRLSPEGRSVRAHPPAQDALSSGPRWRRQPGMVNVPVSPSCIRSAGAELLNVSGFPRSVKVAYRTI